MSWFSDLFGGNKTTQSSNETTTYSQLPEFAEAEGARKDIYGRLKEWGTQPGYGAIPVNWNDLWGQAKKRTSQSIWGSPMDSGAAGKVKAGLAAKNMGDQPAGTRTLARLGAQESGMLSDIAVNQALQEALWGEQGRQDWMNNLFKTTQIKPTYAATGRSGTTTQTSGGGEGWGLLSGLGSMGMQLMGQNSQNAMLKELIGGGSGTSTSGSGGGSSNKSYWDSILGLAGGTLGAMVGGPVGASIGSTAGSTLGKAVVGDDNREDMWSSFF